MKTIIDGRLLLPRMTGIGRYLMGLTQAITDITDEHSFELWLQRDLPGDHPIWGFKKKNLTLRRLGLNHMSIMAQWQVPSKLRSVPFTLFHYPHFDLPIFTPGVIVVTIHDLKYIAYPKFFPNFGISKRLLMWAMMIFTARRAKIVITVSEHTKQDMIRFLRINPEKIEVIPEGVETRFHGTYSEGKEKSVLDTYGIKQPFLLCVGEQRPHKNLTSTIKSFSSFKAISGKKHHLVITGTPYAGFNEPETITREFGLTDLVHFVYISDPDLPVFYQAADAYLNLSLYEGFGLPVLEAMASGTPVIASNRSSLPEIVGSAGILVNPKDIEQAALAMEKITSPGDFRDGLISTGRERAKMFTWEHCAQKTLNVYLEAA